MARRTSQACYIVAEECRRFSAFVWFVIAAERDCGWFLIFFAHGDVPSAGRARGAWSGGSFEGGQSTWTRVLATMAAVRAVLLWVVSVEGVTSHFGEPLRCRVRGGLFFVWPGPLSFSVKLGP